MKNSSNMDMETIFDQLSKLKQAEPSENLYSKTMLKIQKRNTIPVFWVRVAACLLIIIIASELYISASNINSRSHQMTSIICKTNNTLYYE